MAVIAFFTLFLAMVYWASGANEGFLTNSMFYTTSDGKTAAHCPSGSTLKWTEIYFDEGGMHDYYNYEGKRVTDMACQQACANREDCFMAQYFPISKSCYTLTTTSDAFCTYARYGHYGAIGETCSPSNPCPSYFKQCVVKRYQCSLYDVALNYCDTSDETKAVDAGCKYTGK